MKSMSFWVILITAIIWAVWDLAALYFNMTTLSEEITGFSYKSISPPLLIGLLTGHFFFNRYVEKYSKDKYDGKPVGYAKVSILGKILIGSVFVITAWDVFGAWFNFFYPSIIIVKINYYAPAYPLVLGIFIGSTVWPAEVKK